MKLRTALAIPVALVVLTVGGCVSTLAILAWRQPDRVTLPAPTGALPVGRVFFDWTDEDLIDPLAPTEGTPRELPVWIWYPAAPVSSAPPAEYLPPPLLEVLDEAAVPSLRLTLGRLMTDQENVRSHALDDPDGIRVQLQDLRYRGGIGLLGDRDPQ